MFAYLKGALTGSLYHWHKLKREYELTLQERCMRLKQPALDLSLLIVVASNRLIDDLHHPTLKGTAFPLNIRQISGRQFRDLIHVHIYVMAGAFCNVNPSLTGYTQGLLNELLGADAHGSHLFEEIAYCDSFDVSVIAQHLLRESEEVVKQGNIDTGLNFIMAAVLFGNRFSGLSKDFKSSIQN